MTNAMTGVTWSTRDMKVQPKWYPCEGNSKSQPGRVVETLRGMSSQRR